MTRTTPGSTPRPATARCPLARRRFDGVFFTGVRTTGIYCRPSCPASTPAARNVSSPRPRRPQEAGFRACRRCRPEATPGSPEWDVAADAAGRAMRLIADGVVDREGVEGLAAPLGYTPRHSADCSPPSSAPARSPWPGGAPRPRGC